jgi:hypothetical protein
VKRGRDSRDIIEEEAHMAVAAQNPEKDETFELIASNKVEGTNVYDRSGERLGEVYNFMVNKRTGQVAYAVMSFGGFLGIGEQYHPLPWKALDYDTKVGGYRVNVDRSKLESAPRYAREEDPWRDPVYAGKVSDYWGYPLI